MTLDILVDMAPALITFGVLGFAVRILLGLMRERGMDQQRMEEALARIIARDRFETEIRARRDAAEIERRESHALTSGTVRRSMAPEPYVVDAWNEESEK